MKIIDLHDEEDSTLLQVGQLLVEGFSHFSPHPWPNLTLAMEEVRESMHADRISLVATTPHGHVVGWIGGIRQYDGHVWELHPLVVSPVYRNKGIGSDLVAKFEARVRDHGGLSIYLGADDIAGLTSVSGIDLYPDPLKHLKQLKSVRGRHPFEFYQKMGFVAVGIIPDANGFGKPDIIMAKRVRSLR